MSRVSQARSLGKYFLLVDNMLVVLGFFVVFPLISIRFVDQMGWAALMVGIALGLRQLVQQGLGIFGGAVADRFGAKPMIVTGMLMRAGGFAAMAVAHEPWVLWLSCILSGLGGTLFDPPRAALVVKLVRPHQRGRFFSILMMQDSAGAVIGALLGSWLLQYDFRPGLQRGRGVVCRLRRVQRLVSPGVEAFHRENTGSGRSGPGAARQALCHLRSDAHRLLHAGRPGDADAADYG
jgi:MFS family permease